MAADSTKLIVMSQILQRCCENVWTVSKFAQSAITKKAEQTPYLTRNMIMVYVQNVISTTGRLWGISANRAFSILCCHHAPKVFRGNSVNSFANIVPITFTILFNVFWFAAPAPIVGPQRLFRSVPPLLSSLCSSAVTIPTATTKFCWASLNVVEVFARPEQLACGAVFVCGHPVIL